MKSSPVQELPEGIELTGVCYELFRWEAGPSPGALVDSSMSVILRLGNTVNIRFHWAVGNGSERLTIARWNEGDYLPQTRMEDVSERWPLIMGARVSGQQLSLQETEVGTEPWACRVDFDNESHLVIALGELTRDGEIVYIPDSLVITGSEAIARSYRPPAASSAAWAE